MTRLSALFIAVMVAASLLTYNHALAEEPAMTEETTESGQTYKPIPGLTVAALWAYSPSTQTGLPMRLGLGASLLFPAGPIGIVIEAGGSSSFASFDLAPYVLAAATGPVGPIRIGGGVLYNYSPPWDGKHGHLIGANGNLVIPIWQNKLALGLAMGPRHVIGSNTVSLGGGILLFVTPEPPNN